MSDAARDLLARHGGRKFGAILADPPWRFQNRTGKVAPEHRRLSRYGPMSLAEIMDLPVSLLASDPSHLYLWVPNALLPDGLRVMDAWGFQYKSNIVWHKIRKDGKSDGRGVGFYSAEKMGPPARGLTPIYGTPGKSKPRSGRGFREAATGA